MGEGAMRRYHLVRTLGEIENETGVVVQLGKLENESDVIGRAWGAKRGMGADKINVPLLNREDWEAISDRSQITWGGWKQMKIEDKRKQVEMIGNNGTESGALGSAATNTSENQEIESAASGNAWAYRIFSLANNPHGGEGQVVAEKARPPIPPDTRNGQETSQRGDHAAGSTTDRVTVAPAATNLNWNTRE